MNENTNTFLSPHHDLVFQPIKNIRDPSSVLAPLSIYCAVQIAGYYVTCDSKYGAVPRKKQSELSGNTNAAYLAICDRGCGAYCLDGPDCPGSVDGPTLHGPCIYSGLSLP